MNYRKITDYLCNILLIVGALNWGLVGLFQFDIVAAIFGIYPLLVRIVYTLVGLSGIYTLGKAFFPNTLRVNRKY